MIRIRPADERGHANHGWLDTRFSFSFADYHDPAHMGFRSLRVINDDVIAAGQGFGMHGHRDMEIVTYITSGELEHRDSMGSGSVLKAGDVQRMSAGSGVRHSEFNHSSDHELRLLQIWILPERKGLEPGYEERHFADDEKSGQLRLIASPSGDEQSLRIHQDALIYASVLRAGETVSHELGSERHAWVQIVRGALTLNGQTLNAGDGAAVSDEARLSFEATEEVEFLVFNLN